MSALAFPAERVPRVNRGAAARWAYEHRIWLAAALLVVVVAVSHGYNMLHYPYLEDDEGTYFSQGWAVFHLGRLAPYTYFYDHAPVGWIQIALWQLATGPMHLTYALASGRLLMLLYQIGSALLVLAIGRRYSGKVWVGLFAALLFSLSTYGIFYHRRILLDNIATFWLLLSLFMLTGNVTLRRVWLSALAIGIAVLSKEVAIAAVPALAILAGRQTPRESRLFAVIGWLAIALSVCSIYVLMAAVKGELFAAGTLLGGHHPHVSLLCSLQWQASRSGGGSILDPSSPFWTMARSWAHAEPLLVIGGTLAALTSVIALRRNPFISMLGWTILSIWLFLGRGGIVLVFYLVPLLPFLALAIAAVLEATVSATRRTLPARIALPSAAALIAVAACLAAILLIVGYQRSETPLWTGKPVNGQIAASQWIQRNLPASSRLVIDNYMWNDLHAPGPGGRAFPDAHYYWKVGDDPQVRRTAFKDNWRDVDYVITTPQLVSDTEQQHFPVVTPALEHSVLVKTFDTGGWNIQVRHVDPHAQSFLKLKFEPTAHNPASCMSYGT